MLTKTAKEKKTYTWNEAFAASKEYFAGDELPANVWANKYALRDPEGLFVEKTPADMHNRLAREFARIDKEKYGLDFEEHFARYRDAMEQFSRIVPQGSPMAAVGNPYNIMSASNCIVIESPEDSIAGIMQSGLELAQLMKRRAGVGLDISTLRPDGFKVNNAARTTSGAFSFADFYSYVTRMIAQNGRRGALMITLNVHHPDVEKFAKMKADLSKVTGANVSIRLTDEFLAAVEKNEEYEQRWPCEEGTTPVIRKKVSARGVWNVIIEMATKTAEPGLIFWDRMVKRLPAHSYPAFKSKSTNPCSEICLSAYDSCRLISLNLTGYVKNAFTKQATFDWDLFKRDVHTATQMIDNLVDIELELIKKIQQVCDSAGEKELWEKLYKAGEQGRRTGLGTHGLGDMFAQLNIKYDSDEALAFSDRLYETLRDEAYTASVDLAEVRGPFPAFNWETEKDNDYIKDLPEPIRRRMAKVGRRNISLLTQAPTGTVSLLSKCGEFNRFNISSGVEPVFRNIFMRRKRINVNDGGARVDFVDDLGDKWQHFNVYHGNVLNFIEKTGLMKLEGIDLESEKVQNELNEVCKKLPDFFVTSDQIDWRFRVKLQGVEQLKLDHSISSTINLPKGTSPEVVGGIYLEAWKQNLKGITVYVDGSRSGVLVTSDEKGDKKVDPNVRPKNIIRMQAPKRPKELTAEIHQVTIKGRKWVALVGLLNGEPYEMFGGYSDLIHLPKRHKNGRIVRSGQGKYALHVPDGDEELVINDIIGTFNDPDLAWTTRLISTSLRHGVPLQFVVEQLSKGSDGINDFNKVLSRVLKKYIPDGVKAGTRCGANCSTPDLVYTEGCIQCKSCGWSKCN